MSSQVGLNGFSRPGLGAATSSGPPLGLDQLEVLEVLEQAADLEELIHHPLPRRTAGTTLQ
jgi:hypothetical protein